MNEEVGLQMLRDLKNAFDKNGIEFWLDWGTLLGAIREKGFIKGDHDIDLNAWKKDVDKIKEVCKELPYYSYFEEDIFMRMYHKDFTLSMGFISFKEGLYTLDYLYPKKWLGRFFDYLLWNLNLRPPEFHEGKISPKFSKILIHVFCLCPFRKKLISLVSVLFKKLDSYNITLAIPEYFWKEFKEINFYDMKVKVPKNSEEYLAYKYGDWRTPQKYVYWKDDGTIIKRSSYNGRDEVDNKNKRKYEAFI